MISTTGDLIHFVLRASGLSGIGQTPSAEDANTCLQMLVDLLAQWQRKRWLTFNLEETSTTSTGAQFYTVGPGQDFDVARPVNIKAAYVRILTGSAPNLVDLPVEVIHSREEYASITVKTLETIPALVFLDTQWPIARVYWWPVPPAAQYGLYLTVQPGLPAYSTLVDPINLPPEYLRALRWTLCVEMQMAYGRQAEPGHVAAMNVALATLRAANAQIPQLALPVPLGRIRSDASLVGPGLGRAYVLDQGAALS